MENASNVYWRFENLDKKMHPISEGFIFTDANSIKKYQINDTSLNCFLYNPNHHDRDLRIMTGCEVGNRTFTGFQLQSEITSGGWKKLLYLNNENYLSYLLSTLSISEAGFLGFVYIPFTNRLRGASIKQ